MHTNPSISPLLSLASYAIYICNDASTHQIFHTDIYHINYVGDTPTTLERERENEIQST